MKNLLFNSIFIILLLNASCLKKGYLKGTVSYKSNGNFVELKVQKTHILDNTFGFGTTIVYEDEKRTNFNKIGPFLRVKLPFLKSKYSLSEGNGNECISKMVLYSDGDQPHCKYINDTLQSKENYFIIDSPLDDLDIIKGRFSGVYYLAVNVFSDPSLPDTVKITDGKFEFCR
jgi:hypothetical protein